MKKKVFLFAIVFSLFGSISIAQKTMQTLPTNPEPGKCYVKCTTPNVFETREVTVLVKPAYKKLQTNPAKFGTEQETILVKPETKRYEYVPAVLKTEYVEIQTVQPYDKLSILPAKFSPASEQIETDPPYGKWEYGKLPNCKSANPNDCRTLCWKEYSAKYKQVPTQVLASKATTASRTIPGKTEKFPKLVIVSPAKTKETIIPAEYKTVTRKVTISDETISEVTVPAEYRTEKIRVLKDKGGITYWEEVDCNLTKYNALPILYELGSARITPASRRIIDNNLLKLMNAKPGVKVELASHTDSRGSASSNQDLSQRRAQSVVDYLVSKGISRSRLTAKGYGETRLVNRCSDGVKCTESEHQRNRRTEFKVLDN